MARHGWRSRIERVTPEKVVLSVDGHVPLRVRGFALGWVALNGDRRRVFGKFEQTFSVKAKGRHVVTVGGLLGRDERVLSFDPQHDVALPKPRLKNEMLAPVRDAALPHKTLSCALRSILPRIHVSMGRTNIEVPSENSHE